MSNDNKKNINIELDENIAQGSYSNLVVVNHSPTEFVLDFINIMPGTPKAKVKSRIVITPEHAKRLMKALADNVQKFEQQHGVIKNLDQNTIPLNFGGPKAEA